MDFQRQNLQTIYRANLRKISRTNGTTGIWLQNQHSLPSSNCTPTATKTYIRPKTTKKNARKYQNPYHEQNNLKFRGNKKCLNNGYDHQYEYCMPLNQIFKNSVCSPQNSRDQEVQCSGSDIDELYRPNQAHCYCQCEPERKPSHYDVWDQNRYDSGHQHHGLSIHKTDKMNEENFEDGSDTENPHKFHDVDDNEDLEEDEVLDFVDLPYFNDVSEPKENVDSSSSNDGCDSSQKTCIRLIGGDSVRGASQSKASKPKKGALDGAAKDKDKNKDKGNDDDDDKDKESINSEDNPEEKKKVPPVPVIENPPGYILVPTFTLKDCGPMLKKTYILGQKPGCGLDPPCCECREPMSKKLDRVIKDIIQMEKKRKKTKKQETTFLRVLHPSYGKKPDSDILFTWSPLEK